MIGLALRLALRELHHRVVEFFASYKINGRTVSQTAFRQHGDMRPDERDLDIRVCSLDGLRQTNIPRKPWGTCEKD